MNAPVPLRDSRSEYERRIHRVLAFIDQHLDEPLDLEALAAVAHFSPFHFHRLFTAWCGETLGDYLRRRRVETAALRLATQPRLSVLEAALAVGFGSGEAFARAFKVRFGATPSEWRRSGLRKIDQAERKPGQSAAAEGFDDGFPATPSSEQPMNVTLVDRQPADVAYFRYTGPYGDPVSHFWMEQMAPWMAANQLFGQVRYGISHDDPDITEAARCRYDACVEVPPQAVLSGNPQRTTLPGGRYACTRFEGTVKQIGDSWAALLRGWLPSSGLQLDARPFLEHYPLDARFDPQTGVFDCDLCIPVAPL